MTKVNTILDWFYKRLTYELPLLAISLFIQIDHIPSSWIPFNICCHKMFSSSHGFKFINVVKFQLSIEAFQPSQYNVATSRWPKQSICLLALQSSEFWNSAVLTSTHGVNDIRLRVITMNNCKPVALWLPSKRYDLIILILKLQNFNWYIPFFYTEKLKACICAFFFVFVYLSTLTAR